MSQKESELHHKRDALISANTELKRIEVELAEFQATQFELERKKRDLDHVNRQVEKNYFSESKR